MAHANNLLRSFLLLFSIVLSLWLIPHNSFAEADDGRTGEDLSSLLYDARNTLDSFDMSKAKNVCGVRAALNATHSLFKTRATTYAGSGQDPAETRTWNAVSGTPTSITIDWTPYSTRTKAGVIFVRATVENECSGNNPRELKWASIRYTIPVSVDSNGNFTIRPVKDVHVDTICCGNQRLLQTALFSPAGKIIRAPGTMFPPVATSPKPKPKPTGTSGYTGSPYSPPKPVATSSVPQPKPAVAPAPKPEPWTMENPCPECEDEKAMVEHQKMRIGDFKKEKARQQAELTKEEGKVDSLEKEIKGLESRLNAKKGKPASALDTTTGIRTTAYDMGDGTIVVKRHYPNGREEIIDTYTRRSAQDIKRDLEAKKKQLDRHKNSVKRIKKRIEALEKAIARAKALLQDAITAFKICLDNCNAAQGITTRYSTAAGAAATGATVDAAEDAVSRLINNSEDAVSEIINAAKKNEGTASNEASQQADAAVSVEYSSNLSQNWSLSTKYKWSSGYTYFDTNNHLGYEYKLEPEKESTQGSTGSLSAEKKEWSLGLGYTYKNRFNIGGLPFSYEYKDASSDQLSNTGKTDFTLPLFKKLSLYPRYIDNAFGMLDWGAPASAVGRSVGQYFRGKAIFVPAWYTAALETFDILDEYDFWEDDIHPLEFGTAVYHAVLAAGGNQRDAAIMAARATAYSGGTPAHILTVMLSAYPGPFFYGFGAETAPSWKLESWMPDHIRYWQPLDSKFSPSLLRQTPPTNYYGLQHQFRYTFNDSFTGLSNLNLGNNTAKGYSVDEYPLEWESISPRIGLSYDIRGDGKSDKNWHLNPNWIRKELDVKLDRPISIMHVPTGLFVNSFGENNLLRDPQGPKGYPNDPHYRGVEESTTTSLAKKGLSALFGAVGVGIEEPEWAANYQWGLPAIGLRPLGKNSGWDIYDGRDPNVVVAIIDSGLDLQHPDGPTYLWTNEDEIPDNGKDDDGNGYVDDIHGWNFIAENNRLQDDYGHGTFVAGIIAAKTNNGIGIAGVNPGARIMPLKVSDEKGKASSLSIYRAIRYSVDNGARIINISLGREGISKLEQLGLNYAWNMGCLVVVAAGNQAGSIGKHGPAGLAHAFSVASIDVDGNWRNTSNSGRTVAIAAPGEAIYSLSAADGKMDGSMLPFTETEYHRLHGTSFASPYVAGTASLVWAKHPDLNNRQLANLLLETARDSSKKGWDDRTGAGMVNARAALEYGNRPMAAVRITDLRLHKQNNNILWADLYGVIDGPVESYTVSLAERTKSGAGKFIPVYGPAATMVDDSFICRIPGQLLKGKQWSFRITAVTEDGRTKQVKMSFDLDGDIID